MLALTAAKFCRIVGHEKRLRIIHILRRAEDKKPAGFKGLNFSQLCTQADISQGSLRHHIHMLAKARLIKRRKIGRLVYCRVNAHELHGFISYLHRSFLADSLPRQIIEQPRKFKQVSLRDKLEGFDVQKRLSEFGQSPEKAPIKQRAGETPGSVIRKHKQTIRRNLEKPLRAANGSKTKKTKRSAKSARNARSLQQRLIDLERKDNLRFDRPV